MPRLIEAEIGNLAPRELTFAVPDAMRQANTVYRLNDGAVIMEAVPLIADQDLLYYAYEVPTEELFGLALDWSDNDVAAPGKIKWNQSLFGRLTMECAENCADQFEGLPITDNHVDVEPGKRDEVAVGTFLRDAVIDGDKVRAKALIYSAAAIVKVDANGSELSIGGMAYMLVNEKRHQPGEPDFFIKRINLNHVALVENGRAGPEARLLNHRASIAHKQKETKTMKITINGVEVEVPDVAVNHYSGLIDAANASLANSQAQVTALTSERDTAQGALAAAQTELANAQAQVTTLQNDKPDVNAAAIVVANAHAGFVTEAQRLGHADELVLGDYDRTEVMRTVLNARGAKLADDASADMLAGAWSFAVANANGSTTSVLDHADPKSAPAHLNVAEGAQTAVNNSYFGGGKKEA